MTPLETAELCKLGGDRELDSVPELSHKAEKSSYIFNLQLVLQEILPGLWLAEPSASFLCFSVNYGTTRVHRDWVERMSGEWLTFWKLCKVEGFIMAGCIEFNPWRQDWNRRMRTSSCLSQWLLNPCRVLFFCPWHGTAKTWLWVGTYQNSVKRLRLSLLLPLLNPTLQSSILSNLPNPHTPPKEKNSPWTWNFFFLLPPVGCPLSRETELSGWDWLWWSSNLCAFNSSCLKVGNWERRILLYSGKGDPDLTLRWPGMHFHGAVFPNSHTDQLVATEH